METKEKAVNGYVDPLVTFQAVPYHATASSSSITSLCFLGQHKNQAIACANENQSKEENDDDSEGSSQDEFTSHFQSPVRSLVVDRLALDGSRLATCDFEGKALLWDLGSSTVVGQLLETPRGPGLALGRVGEDNNLLFHTRDPQGTVSLHDTVTLQTITNISTHSHTFCAAAPCWGNQSLVALPSADDSQVLIADWRSPSPVACLAAGGRKKHGMLTSLSILQKGGTNVLLCGMEDGTVLFHDWTTGNDPLDLLSLGSDPVLTLDASPSPTDNSLVCLAGLAGDASELNQMDPSDRGRIAVIKATRKKNAWQSRVRSRLGTSSEKPGVAICRFRPDGRVFAAGGWDKRVRIFHRDGRALTLLRGHEQSICAVDWSPDAQDTGLLASGSSDGRICVWRCFGET